MISLSNCGYAVMIFPDYLSVVCSYEVGYEPSLMHDDRVKALLAMCLMNA